ncbi:hypothetical protein [Paenibacillus timonensis]|uniref:hypothetical protein n=1 Tax=Paenibacillus timonensis TaxID=225915 RepID=UPI003F9C1612
MNKLYWIIILTLCIIIGLLIGFMFNGGQIIVGEVDILGFVGALLGSALSIFGVIVTIRASFDTLNVSIKQQNRERFVNSASQKLKSFNVVKSIIYALDRKLTNWTCGWNDKYEKTDKETLENEIITYLLPNLRVLLEESISVDWEFHELIREFVKSTRSYIFRNDEDNTPVIPERLIKEIEPLFLKIDEHEERLIELFKKYSF